MHKTGFLARLARNQRGAVAPLFIGTLGIVVATSLGGIDLARYSIAQNRLQNALDSATLSAGRNLADLSSVPTVPELGTWQEDAYAFFRANMPDGYMGSSIAPDDLHIEYEAEMSHGYAIGQIIRMDAEGTLPLISTGYLNVSSMNLKASNEAIRRTRSDLEVVMALDNTGSMAGTRLRTLKSAARDLTETVLGASRASGVEGRVFVGLVPFAENVNVGSNANTRQWMQSWVNQNSSQRRHFIDNLWMGCISEPVWNGGRYDEFPAEAWQPMSGFQPLTIVSRTNLTRGNLGLSSSDTLIAGTTNRPQPISFGPAGDNTYRVKNVTGPLNTTNTNSGTNVFRVDSWANTAHCKSRREVLFMTDNESAINNAIDLMDADGGTIIPTGLLWAWRMLRPDWRGTPGWGDPDKPRDPEPKVLSKVIVLLTDGDNEATTPGVFAAIRPNSNDLGLNFDVTYDVETCTTTGWGNNRRTTCTTNPKTSEIRNRTADNTGRHPMNSLRVRSPEDFSNTNDTTIGYRQAQINPTALDQYLEDLCTAVKNDGNGIKIYTVTLGQLLESTNQLMLRCSSGVNYAYKSDSVSDLPMVFKSIAGALTELRLTK